ncbi:hypothetical protein ACWCV9_31905 [Streptomyces sp. NPDC001606]
MRRTRAAAGLLALILAGLGTGCSVEPSVQDLRNQAESPEAKSHRAAAERRIHALVARLGAVEGLEHIGTRLTDTCYQPHSSLFDSDRSSNSLECRMGAVAYFGVRGRITDVLPRLRAARIAAWGPRDATGDEVPSATGTVSFALDYYREHGRFQDGTRMPAPVLRAPGLSVDWDRPGAPGPHRLAEPAACSRPTRFTLHERCTTTPRSPLSLTAARTRYGTLLSLTVDDSDSPEPTYYTARRSGL